MRPSPAPPAAERGPAARAAPARLLSPAARLLFRCVSSTPADDAARRAMVSEGVNWEELLTLARAERAVPVVAERLHALGADGTLDRGGIPDQVRAHFARFGHVEFFRAMHRRDRLHAVIATLAGAGIEVTLLKGAAMAVAVYRDFAARPMSDFDLLVTPDRALEAHALLRQHGWRTDGVADPTAYRGHHHLPPLTDGGTPALYLELHTGLLAGAPMRLDADDIRAAAERVVLDGHAALVPSADHLLLHACAHYAWGHMLRGAAWRTFRDVAAIAATSRVDWTRFAELAVATRASSCCYWTFRLGRTLSGVEVPDDILARLRPARPAWVLDLLERHFVTQVVPGARPCPSVRLEKRLWEMGIDPLRSGHGAVRPWDHSDDFVRTPRASVHGWDKLAHHAAHVARWARYGRAIVAPSPRASGPAP